MRLRQRALLIVAGALVWLIVGFRALAALGVIGAVVWLAALVVVPNLLLSRMRCPHCAKPATRLPSGRATAFPGARCRHCGHPY